MTHRGPFQPLLFCDSVIQTTIPTHFCKPSWGVCIHPQYLHADPAPGAAPLPLCGETSVGQQTSSSSRRNSAGTSRIVLLLLVPANPPHERMTLPSYLLQMTTGYQARRMAGPPAVTTLTSLSHTCLQALGKTNTVVQ